jgi:hypothetical protein
MDNRTIYDYRKDGAATFEYTFLSTGKRGTVEKRVRFDPLPNEPSIFNLVLFDIVDGIRHDDTITDNGDTSKVLGTVAAIVHDLFVNNRDVLGVVGVALDPIRGRLYKRELIIGHAYIANHYEVKGLFITGNSITGYESVISSKNYPGYLILRKI